MKIISSEVRSGLGQVATKLFDKWELSDQEHLQILCLDTNDIGKLDKFRKGRPTLYNEMILQRIYYLLAIHKNFGLLFPQNPKIKYSWVRRRNCALGNNSPLQVMLNEGLAGIITVYNHTTKLVEF